MTRKTLKRIINDQGDDPSLDEALKHYVPTHSRAKARKIKIRNERQFHQRQRGNAPGAPREYPNKGLRECERRVRQRPENRWLNV